MNPAVVLPLQLREVIREALDSLPRLAGELVGPGIIDPSRCSHDLVGAAEQGTSLTKEGLRLLGCFRRRDDRAQVGVRSLYHFESPAVSRPPERSVSLLMPRLPVVGIIGVVVADVLCRLVELSTLQHDPMLIAGRAISVVKRLAQVGTRIEIGRAAPRVAFLVGVRYRCRNDHAGASQSSA